MIFKPSVIILSGPPFTGKTTLSRMLASHSNFIHVDIDDFRAKALGHDQIIPDDQDIIITSKCYETMHEYSHELVEEGSPVSIAATYWRPAYKPLVYKFLKQLQVPVLVFELSVSDDLVMERVQKRLDEGSPSDVKSFEQYERYKKYFDPIVFPHKILLNTDHSIDADFKVIVQKLDQLKK